MCLLLRKLWGGPFSDMKEKDNIKRSICSDLGEYHISVFKSRDSLCG